MRKALSRQSGRWVKTLLAAGLLLLLAYSSAMAQSLEELRRLAEGFPAAEVEVGDVPNDDGSKVYISWPTENPFYGKKQYSFVVMAATDQENLKPIDAYSFSAASRSFMRYKLDPLSGIGKSQYWGVKPPDEDNPRTVIVSQVWERQPDGTVKLVDIDFSKHQTVYLKLAVRADSEMVELTAPLPATPVPQRFNGNKVNNLLFTILFSVIVLWMINVARREPEKLFIRKISGLEALDEAIGRATEMGKPILFLNGLDPIQSIATIASLAILGRVARKAAEFEAEVLVPCRDPVVMSMAREMVKEGFTEAGRPDAYKEENIFYLTDDQFAYTAAVNGIMVRERPAANFFMGYYYAESLLLAETGAMTGAIQVAGTDALAQLPFFITTCDYTLIGEELYAASAYLSRQPMMLGSIKGQDYGKMIIMVVLLLGVLGATLAAISGAEVLNIIKYWLTKV